VRPEGPVEDPDGVDDAAVLVVERVEHERSERVARLAAGLSAAIGAAGLPVRVPAVRSLFGIYFGDREVTDYDGARESVATGLYAPFFSAMLARQVALAPSGYEVGFCSMAHSEADIDRTVEAAAAAAEEVAAGC